MEIIKKVLSNNQILYQIFKFLSLHDQIKLLSVCKKFEFVIEHFIWKGKFKEINVIEPDDENYFITFNDAANNEYNLMENECQAFFSIMSKHVQNLRITRQNKEKLTDFYNFENLKLLEFQHAIVTQNNLKSLTINCPKLEAITFIHCTNLNSSTFNLNKRGQMETLAKVNNLKHLTLAGFYVFDWSQLKEILNQFCLKSLHLELFFHQDEVNVKELKNCHTLESLNIFFCNPTEAWGQFQEIYIKKFTNLKTLILDGANSSFKDKSLLNLAEYCNNLKELSLSRWSICIEEFPQNFKLKKLTLNSCHELTWKNLEQILSNLKLEEFVSHETVYQGPCIFFRRFWSMANTLQIIDIKTVQNKNLLKLFYYVNKIPENLKIFRFKIIRNYPFKLLNNFLKLCTNLQELCLSRVAIPIDDLMSLKQLKILKIHIFPTMNWLFLSTLLTHGTLENIFLEMSEEMERKSCNNKNSRNKDFDLMILKETCSNLDFNANDFATSLLTIKMPFMVIHKHQDMFLDLLQMKKDLKITLHCYYNAVDMLNQTFLNKLLNNAKFPTHIKYIKIHKKYYDCNDLKENFATTVDDISETGCLLLTI